MDMTISVSMCVHVMYVPHSLVTGVYFVYFILTRRISIATIFRSDSLLRSFRVNYQHIEIIDDSQESNSDSCVVNNFFDVRKE